MAGVELDGVVRGWATAFTEEVKDFAAPEVVDDSQVGEEGLQERDCIGLFQTRLYLPCAGVRGGVPLPDPLSALHDPPAAGGHLCRCCRGRLQVRN